MHNAMLCGRCDAIHKTDRLLCPECGFVMVGVVVLADGTVKTRTPPPQPPKVLRPRRW